MGEVTDNHDVVPFAIEAGAPDRPDVVKRLRNGRTARRALALAAAVLTIVSTVVAVARGVRSASQSSPLTLTRVTTDAFTAGPVATGIGGLAPPGDGLSVWSAAGWLADQRTGHRSPAVWSSTDGRAWQQTLLDEAGA